MAVRAGGVIAVQEVLVGSDIGLIFPLVVTYLQWRRLRAMREIEEAVSRGITKDIQNKVASEVTGFSSRI